MAAASAAPVRRSHRGSTPVAAAAQPRTARNSKQIGNNAVLRAALRGLKDDLVFLLEGTAPAERGLPEGGGRGRVCTVNAQALDAYTHAATMTIR